jgi:8-oxo-dGTP pyrophosphatase MutT (NUDIX family)
VTKKPATPRPAATIILLRRGGRHADRGLEILMVRRGAEQSFMPGVWVFPGGAIDEGETAEQCATRELAEETGIELEPGTELHAWSRWITPEVVPVRFDTHFFVALAPAHSPPNVDGHEVDDAGWFNPQRALEAHAAGQLKLVFPTIRTLETLVPYANAEEVLAAAPERELEPILPRVAGTREDHRVLLPGDEGYENAAPDVDRLPS